MRAHLSPQSAPSLGGNCQSTTSHIAPSLKLIAIVNPGDPRAIALLERILPPNTRKHIKGGFGLSVNKVLEEEKKNESRDQTITAQRAKARLVAVWNS